MISQISLFTGEEFLCVRLSDKKAKGEWQLLHLISRTIAYDKAAAVAATAAAVVATFAIASAIRTVARARVANVIEIKIK